ncbi:FIST signal transduction protein [Acidihalobacter ferrooxydans]|uniref:Histidine kinase n=1 Tax=Acidihalobacter ferrooxydans TaxID=1765967 RepID=A0A1P8UKB0_9GAMM|nr:FIST N-terminal domain-containing protein [Acidihalobacter ferrooxydans]APZ44255.1 histidine kinase [Acidihalobacter ferrooxydans]
MQRFALAHTTGTHAQTLVADLLRQLGPQPDATIGFIYASDALAAQLEDILDALRTATGVQHWVGSVGMALSVTGHEYYDSPALAVMLADFPPQLLREVPPLRDNVEDFVGSCHDWLERHDGSVFGVLHGDPGNPATPLLIEQLAERLPRLFAVGGITSSQSENFQVAGGKVVKGGVSGVLFAPEIAVATGHTQGCTPSGPQRRITRSRRNVLVELDDRPALEVLKADIGEVLARDLNRLGGYIFAGLPVRGNDDGDYLVRNLIGIDTTQNLVAIGDYAQEGAQLMFCRRDGNTARIDLLRMLGDLQGRIAAPPRGALYVSCLGRGRHQFGAESQELELIRQELGDVPLLGFFANGEIFANRLYGYTGVLTLFL